VRCDDADASAEEVVGRIQLAVGSFQIMQSGAVKGEDQARRQICLLVVALAAEAVVVHDRGERLVRRKDRCEVGRPGQLLRPVCRLRDRDRSHGCDPQPGVAPCRFQILAVAGFTDEGDDLSVRPETAVQHHRLDREVRPLVPAVVAEEVVNRPE